MTHFLTTRRLRLFFVLLALGLTAACQTEKDKNADTPPPPPQDSIVLINLPAPGFDEAGSDSMAIAIADQVMEAMGGRQAWDQTRYLSWNFFGVRSWWWDRYTGLVRYEVPGQGLKAVANVMQDTGSVIYQGQLLQGEGQANALQSVKSAWINDSYWLIMPFKLKDTGVTLKYLGKDSANQVNKMAHVLQLTFKEVGVTPQNLYKVYVDPETNLVCQWDYYSNAADSAAGFQLPWQNYQKMGGILISGDRGPRQLTDIAVPATMADSIFTLANAR